MLFFLQHTLASIDQSSGNKIYCTLELNLCLSVIHTLYASVAEYKINILDSTKFIYTYISFCFITFFILVLLYIHVSITLWEGWGINEFTVKSRGWLKQPPPPPTIVSTDYCFTLPRWGYRLTKIATATSHNCINWLLFYIVIMGYHLTKRATVTSHNCINWLLFYIVIVGYHLTKTAAATSHNYINWLLF